MICVWPRVKSPEPCVRGMTDTSTSIGRICVADAAVRPPLVDRDLLADEALVDRVARLADVALRERVLARPSVAGRRERQLHRLDDPVVEQVALGRLQLLRVLLGLGQPAQLALELLADRASRRRPSAASRGSARATCASAAPADVACVELIESSPPPSRRSPRRSRRPRGGPARDARPDLVAVRPLEPLGRRGVEPLRLARLRAELLLRLAELHDLALRDLERLEELLLRHLIRAGLDHRQAVLRADDDQVEIGLAARSPRASG